LDIEKISRPLCMSFHVAHANLKTATVRRMISENNRYLCYNYHHNWHFLSLFPLDLQIASGGQHVRKAILLL